MSQETTPVTSFEELGLSPELLKAVKRMGFDQPTPVQAQTIPVMLDGRAVIAKAPTGTGKTCAFGIPLIESLDMSLTDIQAVILCPTRELCIQIAEELKQLTVYRSDVRIAAVYGGQPIPKQLAQLEKHPHILVATPGRLLDHMGRGTAWLGNVYTAVLDEADEMLKMGFIRDVRRILNATPADTQVVMFSATISRDVMDVAWEYQQDAVEISVEAQGENRPKIDQYLIEIEPSDRLAAMERIIDHEGYKRVMVFTNMKATARAVASRLKKSRRSVECLEGDMPQSQRNRVMHGFREGAFEILVSTDVAARGIDVDDVEAVFNFDIPEENEYYLHRIGRTGRAKRQGAAYTFATGYDRFRIRDIKKYTRSEMAAVQLADDGTLVPVVEEEGETADV